MTTNDPTYTAALQQVPIGPELEGPVSLAITAGNPVLLRGDTGIGKSEFLAETAKKLGIELLVVDVAMFEPGDLIGIPRVIDGRTVHALPAFLPTEGEGLLHLEELNRADAFSRHFLLQLLSARRIGQYELPPGWKVVGSINPDTPDFQVHEMDRALGDRFLTIDVVSSPDAWIKWAEENEVSSGIIDIAKDNQQLFDFASPRTWKRVSDLVLTAEEHDFDARTLEQTIGCQLGSIEAARTTMSYLQGFQGELLNPHDLLLHYHRDQDLQSRLSEHARAGRTDVMNNISLGVRKLFESGSLSALLASGGFQMEAFERLQQDLPADLAEGMRRSFSEHPDAGKAIGTNGLTVDIDEAFQQNFAKSTLYRRILKWDKEPTQRYKIAIVLRAVADRLGEMRRAGNLNRVNRTLRLNVGRLIKGNEDVAAPLMLTAHNLGIVPMPM